MLGLNLNLSRPEKVNSCMFHLSKSMCIRPHNRDMRTRDCYMRPMHSRLKTEALLSTPGLHFNQSLRHTGLVHP
jgi:hypothetical protein